MTSHDTNMAGALPGRHRAGILRAGGRALRAVFALDTLRGRFLVMALLLLGLLVGLAWLVGERVRSASHDNTGNLSDRHEIYVLTHLMANRIWEMDDLLQSHLLLPSTATAARFAEALDGLLVDADQLCAKPWIVARADMQKPCAPLHDALRTLKQDGLRLIAVRLDPQLTYPGMGVMLNTMQPTTEEFIAHAMLGIQEANENTAAPRQTEVLRLFYDSLYSWSRMIGAFRLYVSNRFGIFDATPERAMRNQASIIVSYSERVRTNLASLERLEQQDSLLFQQAASLNAMRDLHRSWNNSWHSARAIWSSERWRLDTPMMRDNIQPRIDQIWSLVRDIEKRIDAHSSRDLSDMTGLAGKVSQALWLLVLAGVLVVGVALLLFEFQIRRPIARVVAALKAEAAGEHDIVVPETRLVETRDLVEAFDRMRHEVQIRQEAINAREQRLSTILNNTAEGIISFDEFGGILNVNHSAERLFGWSESEILGTTITLLIAPSSRETRDEYLTHFLRSEIQRLLGHEGELVGRHRDGSTFPMAVKVTGMQLEGRQKYVALVSNISERKALMEHLQRMAEHDGLTGLYNRSFFQEELARVVERVQRSETASCALLYIDLDHFKFVNDTLGHAAGDKLLIEVAAILTRRARKSDLVARLGGDEFIVLMYETSPEQMATTADSFRRKLADYDFLHEGQTVTIGCSIGVAMIDRVAGSAATILSRADLACHLAKRAGRNQVHVFSSSDTTDMNNMSLDMGWSRRIRDAIDHNRFLLACQPVVSTRTRSVSTYEVLIRMRDKNGELIMPAGFLPTAERFGLSIDIDRWVIANAIDTLAEQRRLLPDLSYTINLSAQSLASPEISELIQARIESSGLDPAALVFEITETAAIADLNAAVNLLSRLRALGCRTALDDFGSGMSSFAYLKELPVDIVKIDGRFVRHIATNPVDQAMVRAMNDIAHALGKQTIAEFVEDEAAFEKLIEYGVDFGQGYHLGRPDLVPPCRAIAERAGMGEVCRS